MWARVWKIDGSEITFASKLSEHRPASIERGTIAGIVASAAVRGWDWRKLVDPTRAA